MKTNLVQVTPFMHVSDVSETVRFFTERLGFHALVQRDDYAYVHREAVGFRILRNAKNPELGHRRILYYVDVADVAEIVAELGPKLADLPETSRLRPKGPGLWSAGVLVRLPDGMVLAYGQAIVGG